MQVEDIYFLVAVFDDIQQILRLIVFSWNVNSLSTNFNRLLFLVKPLFEKSFSRTLQILLILLKLGEYLFKHLFKGGPRNLLVDILNNDCRAQDLVANHFSDLCRNLIFQEILYLLEIQLLHPIVLT